MQLLVLSGGWFQHSSTTSNVCPSSDGSVGLSHVGVDGEAPSTTFGRCWATIGQNDWSGISWQADGWHYAKDVSVTQSNGSVEWGLEHASDVETEGGFTCCSLVDHGREETGCFSRHAGSTENGSWIRRLEGGDLSAALLSGAEESCAYNEGSKGEEVCFHG